MGIEKDGSKSGGFFQLFDWTAKSRKKLFSSKSDIPEHSKQGKKNDGNLPTTRLRLINDDETVARMSFKGSSDYSCASSVTDEEGYGSRPPSVVARLMGLDSLPGSNFQEPYSPPFFDTQSLQDAHYHRKDFDYYQDHRAVYNENTLKKMESQSSRNLVESKPQKILNRPLEKFQTEVLPPKSAKSIPSTHHKLLSPIKGPGFFPSKNAVHIMEAAAKMIEPKPQATAKAKMPLVGSTSVPLKVQALKEKVEASQKVPLVGSSSATLKVREVKQKVEVAPRTSRLAEASQRPVESNAAKYLKGQSLTKSWNGSVDTPFRSPPDKEEGSSASKNKGKSISLAIQAKVNVQRREGLSSSRSEVDQREQSEVQANHSFRSQPQRNLHKKSSMQNTSGVLRQNNQKQNCLTVKDNLPSKPSVSNSQGRKVLPRDSSSHQKSSTRSSGNTKIGSRKSSLAMDDAKEEAPYSSTRNFPRKKRMIDGDHCFNKNESVDNSLHTKNQKPVKASSVSDSCSNWAEDSRRKGIDVVSFTFTAPLTRSVPASEISEQDVRRRNGFSMEHQGKRMLVDSDSMKLSSLGYNVIGGDALSMLLEEKLKELTFGLESSIRDSFKVGSASSSASPRINEQRDPLSLPKDKFGAQFDFKFSTTGPPATRLKQKFQEDDEMEECSSSNIEDGKMRSCRHPSPVSILEPSFSNESYDSSISTDSNSTEGSKLCSSVQAQEVHASGFQKKFHSMEADTELSDSASSTSTNTISRKQSSTVIAMDLSTSTAWELEYVKEMLYNVELMFKDFALGRSRDIINPRLFNLLESRKGVSSGSDGGESKLRRKVLFDCTSECLDLRYGRYANGGYEMWVKGVAMVRRKEWLAEEVYKEISGWRAMGDSMVDELVDKDMSTQYGKWLDFEVDAFALGVEVEAKILNSLLDEIVADMIF
ncbi:hypothetical protein UlMin_009624 [Ulmus minor]